MLSVLLAVFGVSGTLYILFRLWWPTWYLDLYHQRCSKKVTDRLLETAMKGLYLIDLFEENAKKTPQKSFIIYEDVKYTYEFMDKKANQACRTGIEIGLKPGSIVAVLMYNEPGFVWTYLGKSMLASRDFCKCFRY